MKKNIFLIIILIIALIVWAWLGFSSDIGVFEKILAVFNGIITTLTLWKLLEERYSKKIPELTKEKKDVTEDQISYQNQTSFPVAKADVYKKIRSLSYPIKRDEVMAGVGKILGETQSEVFWKKIDEQPDRPLSSLVQHPFWLEGLILVFEQNKDSFPKNDGRLLSQLLLNQWMAEKLDIKNIISLDILHSQLGKLVMPYRDINFSKNYYKDEQLLEDLGDVFKYKPSFSEKLFYRIIKDPQKLFKKIENFSEPWRSIIFSLFEILFHPLKFLKFLLFSPITLLLSLFGRWANQVEIDYDNFEKQTIFRKWIILFLKTHRKFNQKLMSFFSRLNIRKRRNIQRGNMIVQSAKKIGILDFDEKNIWFTKEYWRDYFIARKIILYDDSLKKFLKRYIHLEDKHHRSPDTSWVPVAEGSAVIASGLYRDPIEAVNLVFRYDAITASKCLLSLSDNLPKNVFDKLKIKILEQLCKDLESVEYDGNSYFCIENIRAMRSLSDSPYYAKIALEKIPEIYPPSENRKKVAKIIATFGTPIYDILITKSEDERTSEELLYYILIVLGELRDKRAIPPLRKLLDVIKYDISTKAMIIIVLATYFNDEKSLSEFEKYLRFELSEKKNYNPWQDFDVCGEDAIFFALRVMEKASLQPKNQEEWRKDTWSEMKDSFLSKLQLDYQENPKVEEMLLSSLENTNEPRMIRFLIEAFGETRSQKSIPKLIGFLQDEDDFVRKLATESLKKNISRLSELLQNEDDYVRNSSVESLKQIDPDLVCSTLEGLLYSGNLQLVVSAMNALSVLRLTDAIPAIKDKLKSEAIEKYWDSDPGYPIAFYAVDALIWMGVNLLKEKDVSEDKKKIAEECLGIATEWCKARLGDKTPLRYYQNVTCRALDHLYNRIGTPKSRLYYSAWVQEHPEDRTY